MVPVDPVSSDVGAARGAEEAELLASAVGDGSSGPGFAELYRRYEGRIYGLGRRLLGDDALAEELVQETFVRLWRSAAKFNPGRGRVEALLFTIARRVAVDLWRRPSSRPFQPDGGEERAAPGDAAESLVLGLVVRDALDALSPPHREVLELSYHGDLTQAQIAERLGVPLGTVKTRAFYALRALKLALAERGVES